MQLALRQGDGVDVEARMEEIHQKFLTLQTKSHALMKTISKAYGGDGIVKKPRVLKPLCC